MTDDLILELDDGTDVLLEDAQPIGGGGARDYNRLKNRPVIGGVTVEGEKNLSDYAGEYIIIEGGVASGYAES